MARPTTSQIAIGAVGAACVAGGTVLVLRPFTTISVLVVLVAVDLALTGLGEIAAAPRTVRPWSRRLAGGALLAGAAIALAWPDVTLRALALVVGVSMIVGGIARLGGPEVGPDGATAAGLRGVTAIVLGVLALVWPAVTVLVVAVLFGVQTVVFGLDLLAEAFVPRAPAPEPPAAVKARRREIGLYVRSVVVLVALSGALALAVTSIALHGS